MFLGNHRAALRLFSSFAVCEEPSIVPFTAPLISFSLLSHTHTHTHADIVPLRRTTLPDVSRGSFIHPSAWVAGDVNIAVGASIWPGCVLRGETIVMIDGDGNVIVVAAAIDAIQIVCVSFEYFQRFEI